MKLNTSQITPNNLSKATLYIVAMPLGNLDDFSPRARNTLELADFILAEDTKRAALILSKLLIPKKEIHSLNEHNENEKLPIVLRKLKENKSIALISDAGMPIISDPGYLLVSACRKEGYDVTVIPGPCAPVTALAGSGIAPLPFTFLGFLPRTQASQEKTLSPFASVQSTFIFFERKDRLFDTLKTCYAILGNRDLTIARELTKIHEEYFSCELCEIEKHQEKLSSFLGEITVVLGQAQEKTKSSIDEIDALIESERRNASSPRNLAKRVQSLSIGWTTSEIYTRI